MKLKRITPLIALVIAAILCFTSCSGSNRAAETETSGRLDLDYVENHRKAMVCVYYRRFQLRHDEQRLDQGGSSAHIHARQCEGAIRAGRRADGAARKECQANGCVQHGSDTVRTADRNAKAGRKRHERARTERNARSHSRTDSGAEEEHRNHSDPL